ncbi:MAG: response regulator [Aquabacterium sp.]|nr:response regulator [Aquabacterium sp.]
MKRLLLVDDDPLVLFALKDSLSRLVQDWRVEAFSDPNVALARLKDVGFDVIVSDYRMPQMNGIDFLRSACRIQPHVVRIILSSSSDFEIVQQAINEVEIYRYLAKPWVESDLIRHVTEAMAHADQTRVERELADSMRVQQGVLSAGEQELRRLEELEPGLTVVEWGPNGEILMPEDLLVFADNSLTSK